MDAITYFGLGAHYLELALSYSYLALALKSNLFILGTGVILCILGICLVWGLLCCGVSLENLGDSFAVVGLELWMGISVERYCISILVTALKLQ
jgi:hypothetical protein